MPKPKAPRWLTEAFRDGVDEAYVPDGYVIIRPAYPGAMPGCWLAHHDPTQHLCSGPLERFHFIPRQRVENAMWEALREARILIPDRRQFIPLRQEHRDDLILLAAWDPRNGGLGCEHHHRRFDGHATSPRAPKIEVDHYSLPQHVWDYVYDYGLESEANRRFVLP